MNRFEIIFTNDKKIFMVLEGTKFARKTAHKKNLVRLICARTNVAPKQSLISEGRNKIFVDRL